MEVLHFGGGKDSLACLYLLRDRWEHLTVVWMNTGAAFPETIAQMEQVRAMVPHFLEVRSQVLAHIQAHGWPADVLPVKSTSWGQRTTGDEGIRLQSWFDCCAHNLWWPMQQKMKELGVSTIYRGQRLSEGYKAPIRSGEVIDGVRYVFPLEDWSEAQVEQFLVEQGITIPAHYHYTKKSLDCWCCTAYLDEKIDQLAYMKVEHPERFATLAPVLREMRAAVRRHSEPLFATEELS